MLLVTAHPKLFLCSQVLNTVIVHLRIEQHFLASSTRDDDTIYGMRAPSDEVATKDKRLISLIVLPDFGGLLESVLRKIELPAG